MSPYAQGGSNSSTGPLNPGAGDGMAVVAELGGGSLSGGRSGARLRGAMAGMGDMLGCWFISVCAILLDQIDVGAVHSFKPLCPAYKPELRAALPLLPSG